MTDEKLEDLRARIDELDLQILDLLNKRMSLSLDYRAFESRGKSKCAGSCSRRGDTPAAGSAQLRPHAASDLGRNLSGDLLGLDEPCNHR